MSAGGKPDQPDAVRVQRKTLGVKANPSHRSLRIRHGDKSRVRPTIAGKSVGQNEDRYASCRQPLADIDALLVEGDPDIPPARRHDDRRAGGRNRGIVVEPGPRHARQNAIGLSRIRTPVKDLLLGWIGRRPGRRPLPKVKGRDRRRGRAGCAGRRDANAGDQARENGPAADTGPEPRQIVPRWIKGNAEKYRRSTERGSSTRRS